MPVNAQVIQTMTDWLITLTAPARSIPGVCLLRNQLGADLVALLGDHPNEFVDHTGLGKGQVHDTLSWAESHSTCSLHRIWG